MNTSIQNFLNTSALLIVFSALAACSTTSLPRNAGLDSSTTADKVAFGDLRLVTNGVEARLGDGLFASDAGMHLYNEATNQVFVARVENRGQFNMKLNPGVYRVTSVFFKYHGETVEADTNFVFRVAEDTEATYIGTIKLEASLDNGAYGVIGSADRFSVLNECAEGCGDRMALLGLPHADHTASLFHWERRVASTD